MITRVLAAVLCVLAWAWPARADLANPGPYLVGERSVTVTRANNTTFTAIIWYPATSNASNAPLDPAGRPYPAISFGHGFLQTVDRYESTLRHLASHGYLVIATTSEGSLFPNHSNFALDIRQCLTWLEQQNTQPASFLFQALAVGQYGLSGHSMGGGASILAAAADARIKALAPLAAANTNPSSITAMAGVDIPVTLIAGSNDTIVPPGPNNAAMYSNGAAPKLAQVITGGWHCGFQDVSVFGCDSGPMPRADQLAITRRLLTAFFNLYLKSDQGAWPLVWGPARDADPRVVSTAEAGIAVAAAPPALASLGGRVVSATVTVRNTGPLPTSYDVLAEGGRWPVTIAPQTTAVLQPGQQADVVVSVRVPAGRSAAEEAYTVSARRALDHGTRGYTTLRVQRLSPDVR